MNISAFKSRDFRLYFAGNAFSLQGLWIQRVTLAWLAWDLTGRAGFVGLIAFLSFAPTMLSGPFFGLLADRVPVIAAARVTQGGQMLMAVVAASLQTAGLITPPVLSAIALGIGIITSAHHPVRMTLAPLLVGPTEVSSVIAATSINFNLARTVGPAIGGWLIATLGIAPTLWIIAAAYVPYLVILPLLSPRGRAPLESEDLTVLSGIARGARWIWGNAFTRRIILATGVFAFLGRGMLEILPIIADGLFQRGATGLGTLTSAVGIGALISTFLLILMPPLAPGNPPRLGYAAVMTGLCVALALAYSRSWTLSLGLAALLGGCGSLVGVSMQSALQLMVPDGYRGRVMSLWVMTGIGSASVGAMLIGTLADRVTLGTATALTYVAGIGVFLLLSIRPRG